MYAVGVCRTSDRGFDKTIEQKEATTKVGVLLAKRTFYQKAYVNGEFTCLGASYYDSKPVHMLSSYHRKAEEKSMIRKVWDATLGKLADLIFYRLDIIDFYNKWMNGVDMADQLMWYYRLNTKQHRYRKWWWPIWLWALNLAITNAYIMYKIANEQAEEHRKKKLKEFYDREATARTCRDKEPPEHLVHPIRRYSHRQFRSILAHQLVHGDRDWGKHTGQSQRTQMRKRQMEAEADLEKCAPVRVVKSKDDHKGDRFYAKTRLYEPETWPDHRLSCTAKQGTIKGEIVGLKERHYFYCQVCYSRRAKKPLAKIYCKDPDCGVKFCTPACMDDYHGKHVMKTNMFTGEDNVINI